MARSITYPSSLSLNFSGNRKKSISFASLEQKFLQLEEQHALQGSSHWEGANAAILNPNPHTASIMKIDKKGKGGQQRGCTKRAPMNNKNSTIFPAMAKPSIATTVANQDTKKSIVPKEGEEANWGIDNGIACGSLDALATQSTRYASCMHGFC